MENSYKKSLLDPETFSVTWELVPGRGAREKAQDEVFVAAEKAAKGGKVHALTITDNPSGAPAILADYLGMEILKLGIEPLVHFTCKDKNRSQIESQLHALARAGVRNLLVLTGDYPVTGFAGRPRPVFDLDPTHVLELIKAMNNGYEVPGLKGPVQLAKTDFFAGAAVSPFKREEAEQITQYYKLRKKLESGAQFVIPQLGYDARKFHEALQFVRQSGWDVPMIGNVYVLTFAAAKLMNANQIAGCVVTSKLLAELDKEREAPDKGKSARLLRAAKMYAFMKGMGFAGVHIGGHGLKHEDVESIIEKGEELTPNWPDLVHEFDFPQPGGFYYYKKDEKTGLNTTELSGRTGSMPPKTFGNSCFRVLHHTLFEPKSAFFAPMRGLAKAFDGSGLEHAWTVLEHGIKGLTNDCLHCGDCALFDLAYLCPMSQCPKNQRNGPCGGSFEGWCEVYPGKRKCIYVRAYERLKPYGEEETLASNHVPPVDWSLYHTSSWLNFYMGRDHVSKKLGIKPTAASEGEKKSATS